MDDNIIYVLTVEKNYEYETIEDAYASLDIPSAIIVKARKAIHQDEADGKIRIDSEHYEIDEYYEVMYYNIAEKVPDKVKYKIHNVRFYN